MFLFTKLYSVVRPALDQRSTRDAIPNGMAFISERRHRNSPMTHVMATHDKCRIHHEGDEGSVEL